MPFPEPGENPGNEVELTPFPTRERGGRAFEEFSLPWDGAFNQHSQGVRNLIARLDFILRIVLIPRVMINHGGDGGDKR